MKEKEQLQVIAWFLSGDVGASSETIIAAYFNFNRQCGISHPCDGGDLGRCIKLINEVPVLSDSLPKLAEIDSHWKALFVNWEELKSAYYLEVGANESGDMSHDKVYSMMEDIFDKRKRTMAI
jgi:hypothetical protein